MYDKFYEKDAKIRLYVRKVLITDEFDDLVPQYLNFLRGVIDSDDLPLNVNREGLQQSKILKVMGKKLVRKAIEMIRKLANADADWESDEDDKDEKGDVKKSPYMRFWDQFGKSLKLGVIEDSANRSKLSKLLRYKTSKSGEDGWRSLEEYVADMKEWQTNIYYIAGESMEALESSPFLEKLKKKGLEVLYLIDPIDEYAMQQIMEFDGKRMMSVTKEGLKFGDEDEDLVAAREKAYKAKFLPLTTYLKDIYDKKINKVVVSSRVETSPVVIVTGQWGNSANMERIMRAQALSDRNKNSYLTSQKTMELNPRHPLVTKLLAMVEDDPDNQETKDAAMMLYDTAALTSGFTIEDVEAYTERMFRVMKGVVGVDSFDLEDEIEIVEEEEDDDDDSDDDEDDLDSDEEDMGEPEL
jgi:heat shock protein 90kDa beta